MGQQLNIPLPPLPGKPVLPPLPQTPYIEPIVVEKVGRKVRVTLAYNELDRYEALRLVGMLERIALEC